MKAFRNLVLFSCINILYIAAGEKSSDSFFADDDQCDACPDKSTCKLFETEVDNSFKYDKADGMYFTCTCKNGYETTEDRPGWECIDIDECLSSPCDPVGGYCVDHDPDDVTFPMYECGCVDGYTATGTDIHGATGCVLTSDINPSPTTVPVTAGPTMAPTTREPTRAPTGCVDTCTGDNRQCVDEECVCEVGYFALAGPNCRNENECQDGYPNLCDGKKATCKDTVGSYTCSCNSGYRDSPTATKSGTDCVDIDECAEGTDTCGDDEICINKVPGFECIENDGRPTSPPTTVTIRVSLDIDGTIVTDDFSLTDDEAEDIIEAAVARLLVDVDPNPSVTTTILSVTRRNLLAGEKTIKHKTLAVAQAPADKVGSTNIDELTKEVQEKVEDPVLVEEALKEVGMPGNLSSFTKAEVAVEEIPSDDPPSVSPSESPRSASPAPSATNQPLPS